MRQGIPHKNLCDKQKQWRKIYIVEYGNHLIRWRYCLSTQHIVKDYLAIIGSLELEELQMDRIMPSSLDHYLSKLRSNDIAPPPPPQVAENPTVLVGKEERPERTTYISIADGSYVNSGSRNNEPASYQEKSNNKDS